MHTLAMKIGKQSGIGERMVSKNGTIETQWLRVFVAIARQQGVTAAADGLGMAKSAASKQLAALETLLQVKLFERASRRVALTGEGRLLLPRAESILAELDQLIDDAQQQRAQVHGTVRMATSPEFGAFLTERFLPVLMHQHAGLKTVLSLEYRYGDLHDPAFDLAFRLGSLIDDRLVGRPLGEFPRVLVCSSGYARSLVLDKPHDLEHANALLFLDHDMTEKWSLTGVRHSARKHEVRVRGNIAIHGFEALAVAAIAGLGVARLPSFVAAPRLADGSLVRVLPEWQSPPVPVYLAYRAGVSRIGRVRAVIDAALQEVPGLLASI